MDGKQIFEDDGFSQEFEKSFESLDIESRDCLLCFSVFPQNAVIKKRLLRHWWIAEGLLDKPIQTLKIPAERVADVLLHQFEGKGFILPVDKKHREVANSFRVSPLARSALIKLAKRVKFFDFDPEGNPTLVFQNSKDCKRACLVCDHREGSLPLRLEQSAVRLAAWDLLKDKQLDGDKLNASKFVESMASFDFNQIPEEKDEEFAKILNHLCGTVIQNPNLTLAEFERKVKDFADKMENIETIFNVSEQLPDFKFDWFTKLKKIKVLHLGKWQSQADDIPQIEIESIDEKKGMEYSKGFKNMKSLRLVSFQGISGIQKLPSEASKLMNLEILDLRACYDLDELPDDIDRLRNLTHLDVSECSLLECIPKKLSSLAKLQVLKGFVISDPDRDQQPCCSLKDLQKLEQLKKLTININSEEFQTKDLSAVLKIKGLLELKVLWKGAAAKPKTTEASAVPIINKSQSKLTKIPSLIAGTFWNKSAEVTESNLQKLDLLCYPEESLPHWVFPDTLQDLKKLYIRAGRLKSLGMGKGIGKHYWKTVKVLRLKYLNELETDWNELQKLFPELEYFEKFKCHKVTLCPCDGNGVWEQSELINLNNSNKQHPAS